MHRFCVPAGICVPGHTVTLPDEESHHALKVLRLRDGEEIRLLDGETLWQARLSVQNGAACAEVLAALPSPEAGARVTLLQGLPKADKLEMIVQKATELGVWRIQPVDMTYCVVHADRFKNPERLSRIALEAAKQSSRAHVPEIALPCSFQKALDSCPEYDLILVAWEEEHTLLLSECIRQETEAGRRPRNILLAVGPEGGISVQEWEQLKEKGAHAVSLGPRILRTETAGLCALSVIWATLGEM